MLHREIRVKKRESIHQLPFLFFIDFYAISFAKAMASEPFLVYAYEDLSGTDHYVQKENLYP